MSAVELMGPDVRIRACGPLRGVVRVPGSKSLTNRYLLCTALADGRSSLTDVSVCDDTQRMLAGLSALGIYAALHKDRRQIVVAGCRGYPPADDVQIDAGEAGTAMRFLTALCCLGFGRRRLDGAPRMRARPLGGLVNALVNLGASIGYEGQPGYPPVTVLARGLTGGTTDLHAPQSSQFLSAVLMVAPYASQDVLVAARETVPSRPYVDQTVQVMHSLGVEVITSDGLRYVVPAFQRYQAGEYRIEPDASAAGYFWTAAALTGGEVRVAGLTRASRQGDVRFVDVLAEMGCEVGADASGLAVRGPATGRLRGVSVDMNELPDAVPTLAVAALFADGPTEIRNSAHLRVKESDRLAMLAIELRRLGATVEEWPDGLKIRPPTRITPTSVDSHGDHRLAMSLALAGLVCEGLVVRAAGCVSKSCPEFFEILSDLCAQS